MRVSIRSINQESIFGSDKYLKIKYNKKKKASLVVKENLTVIDKISRGISNLTGSEYRAISKALNSSAGQSRLERLKPNERNNLIEINKKIEKLNKKFLIPHIRLIQIPDDSPPLAAPQRVVRQDPVNRVAPKPRVKPNELLVNFYTNNGKNSHNQTLVAIWNYSLEEKESAHNYIQWLFPAVEASAHNSSAPKLTPELIDALLTAGVQENLTKSLDHMLVFYGLKWDDSHNEIIPSPTFDERKKVWLNPNNHNHLRLTRIMNSLNSFELNEESQALFACLKTLKSRYPHQITDTTFKYWQKTQE